MRVFRKNDKYVLAIAFIIIVIAGILCGLPLVGLYMAIISISIIILICVVGTVTGIFKEVEKGL